MTSADQAEWRGFRCLLSSVFIGPIRKIKAGYSPMMLFDFGVI